MSNCYNGHMLNNNNIYFFCPGTILPSLWSSSTTSTSDTVKSKPVLRIRIHTSGSIIWESGSIFLGDYIMQVYHITPPPLSSSFMKNQFCTHKEGVFLFFFEGGGCFFSLWSYFFFPPPLFFIFFPRPIYFPCSSSPPPRP